MKKKIISIILLSSLAVSAITGCGKNNTETPAETSTETSISDEQVATSAQAEGAEEAVADEEEAASFDSIIESLHAGQSYAYAPICDGEDALLVTTYTFDLDGKQATYEATIFAETGNSIQKITTVQSGGTAYPIAVTDDNSLIVSKRNDVFKGHVDKASGKFVITEESSVNYLEAEDGSYHNYKDGETTVETDSAFYDELSDKFFASETLGFEKAGAEEDGSPILYNGVYAAYTGDDLYNVTDYYVFVDHSRGDVISKDGMSVVPFTYEQTGNDFVFHFGSAEDTTEAKFGWDIVSYPTLTFTKDEGSESMTLNCLNNQNAETFDPFFYYDNDNNLYMHVNSFDEKSFTGDLYRQEMIKADYVDNAEEGSQIYSVNGTQFKVVSFEEVNADIAYGTDEEFKNDVVGTTRFDGFLVKCSTDDFYYALEKEDYEDTYKVVSMMTDENLRVLTKENVTFPIKENCEIILLKYISDKEESHFEEEYIIGREFKGDHYPGWSESKPESYMTSGMLMSLGVIDGELYNAVQIYVP